MIKKLLVFSLLLTNLSCNIEKIDNVHGITNLKTKAEKIKLNNSNKNDIIEIFGPSPLIDKDEKNVKWSYFEIRETKNKLGRKKIYKNDYIEIYFNTYGVVKQVNVYDLENMNKIEFTKDKTKTLILEENAIQGLLNSTRKRLKDLKKRMK